MTNIFAQVDVKINKKEFVVQKKGKSKALRNIKYGDYYYKQHTQGSYYKALSFYLKAYNYNPDNAELDYKIGICYVEIMEGIKALSYLSKAYKLKPSVAIDIEYFLAQSLQLNNKFDEAIKFFKESTILATNDPLKMMEINKHIEECQNGKKLVANKKKIIIKDLSIINSKYKDYASLISADGTKMFFTSRRPNMTGGIDPEDDQYYEDIYFSKKDSLGWSKPVDLVDLNTAGHDDVVGISHDGNTLILYKNGDLYYSTLRGKRWSTPKAFPKVINSKEIESSACFSLDKNTLYFVRGKDPDPNKSNGDIFYSKKDKNGKWTKPVRLPDNINTPYDEDGLFMFADGKTLYFSSKGHNSMGGFDIFKTTIINDSTYTDPVNLGYPLNSAADDIYFVMSPNNITGYFTSTRADTKGFTDIYQASFVGHNMFLNSEDNLLASIAAPTSESHPEGEVVVVIKGKILAENGKPVDAEILIIDNKTNKVIYKTKANSSNGKYSVTIPVGRNYGMVINKDGYMFHSENFDLVSTSNYKQITKNITIENIKVNSTVTLHNIFFEFGSSTIQKYSIAELNRIISFMKKNPKVKVQISGYTDNVGSSENNLKLSKARANAVAQYLIQHGISADRLTTKGYGSAHPVASNATAEGRGKNRRVEFKIIST